MTKLRSTMRKHRERTLNPQIGCWLHFQLKLRNYTLGTVAQKANVTSQMVTQFLKGRKDSEKVKNALAETLGFESFEKLVAASRGKVEVAV
jgi:transcriptional regulator with XRE-family HTH domain